MRYQESGNVAISVSLARGCMGRIVTIIKAYCRLACRLLKPYLAKCNHSLEPVYRSLARHIIVAVYDIHAVGFEKIPEKGGVLLISNHVSYVDGLIINALCNRRVRYVIDYRIYNLPFVHYFMTLNRAIPISAKKEHVVQAMENISQGLKAGEIICIFPEGRMTYNGFISHFRPGVEWIIARNQTVIYPIVLDGLWGSVFSRKYHSSLLRFMPRDLRRKVKALCGDAIYPEEVTIDRLHLVMLGLRRKLHKRN